MFISLIGLPSAGKHSVLDWLVQNHGFTPLYLRENKAANGANGGEHASKLVRRMSLNESIEHTFSTADDMLDYVTRAWRGRWVTLDLRTWDRAEPFLKRPFFMVVHVEAPLGARYARESRRQPGLSLESFIDAHDAQLYSTGADLKRLIEVSHMTIVNRFDGLNSLYAHLDQANMLDEERLRPGWDMYFMTLASLASHRSNCMKRRVGAVLVRSKRIISTGYNGTPRGTANCNEGGCARCNDSAKGGQSLSNCLCLHAEENALLEAGRERVGGDAVLYCNTCPCLLCSVKIVQCGVREVVYNQSYSMDEASAKVLQEGGVILRQFVLPYRPRVD